MACCCGNISGSEHPKQQKKEASPSNEQVGSCSIHQSGQLFDTHLQPSSAICIRARLELLRTGISGPQSRFMHIFQIYIYKFRQAHGASRIRFSVFHARHFSSCTRSPGVASSALELCSRLPN